MLRSLVTVRRACEGGARWVESGLKTQKDLRSP